MTHFKFHLNQESKIPGQGADLSVMDDNVAFKALRFHQSFDEYKPTPLVELDQLADYFGLSKIWVKDESLRFGLNSFKVLGGSFAMGQYLADSLGLDLSGLSRAELASSDTRKKTGAITFASATDGNHGRGVAWTAGQLGHQAIIFMPRGSAQIRVDNILSTGAQCYVTDMNYDDTVRLTHTKAEKEGWVLIQDTGREGYEHMPLLVMQGYATLGEEILSDFAQIPSHERPTHLFLQAGVGTFAGAILGRLAAAWGEGLPRATIVEPLAADCIFRTAQAADGTLHPVSGDMETIMAGLACGEPSTVSWGILRDYATAYVAMADIHAANGMRIYAAPLKGDPVVVSGESGAATLGALAHLALSPQALDFKAALGLDKKSRVLLISTEGDTAPDIYRDIVWYGQPGR